MTSEIRCPTTTTQPDGTPHMIVGCGSANVTGPDSEGLYDCLDCGIWFDPKREGAGGLWLWFDRNREGAPKGLTLSHSPGEWDGTFGALLQVFVTDVLEAGAIEAVPFRAVIGFSDGHEEPVTVTGWNGGIATRNSRVVPAEDVAFITVA